MDLLLQQITTGFSIGFPQSWVDWCILLVWSIGLIYLVSKNKDNYALVEKDPINWIFYILFTLITSALLRVDLLPFEVHLLPTPALGEFGFSVIVLCCVPWVAAAVFGKHLMSICLAALSGLVFTGFHGHEILIIPLFISIALIFNHLLQREYTELAVLKQHPVLMMGVTIVISIPLFYLERMSAVRQGAIMAFRLDNALSSGWFFYLSRFIELILAGLVGELLNQPRFKQKMDQGNNFYKTSRRKIWIRLGSFLYLILFILTLLWNVGRTNKLDAWRDESDRNLENINAALLGTFTSNAIRIDQLSHAVLLEDSKVEIREEIKTLFQPIQNVDEFYLFDDLGALVFSYPVINESDLEISDQEISIFQNVLQRNNILGSFSELQEGTLYLSILYPLENDEGEIDRIALARVELHSNVAAQPIALLIDQYAEAGNEFYFVNPVEDKRVAWNGGQLEGSAKAATTASQYKPMDIEGWGLDAHYRQEAFLEEYFDDFYPYFLSSLFAMLFIGGYYFYRWVRIESVILDLSERFLTGRSRTTGARSTKPFPASIENFLEVLRQIFSNQEKRYSQIKTYLDLWSDHEINDAFRTHMTDALQIFEADDVLFVKLFVAGRVSEQNFVAYQYAAIDNFEEYSYLDEQVLHVMQDQDQLVIGNSARFHQIKREIGKPFPGAMILKRLTLDAQREAVLWIAYRGEQEMSPEDMQKFQEQTEEFSAHLRAIDSLQIKNMEYSILSNLFDGLNFPLFIFVDETLLYGNKAASRFLNLDEEESYTDISKRVKENVVYNLLIKNRSHPHAVVTQEVTEGQKYEIDIYNEDRTEIGKVSIILMKDITREKRREEITRDYVTMLSHDLRAPITIMQGYSKMLPMVGELNKTQQDYLDKIKNGMTTISSLVQGILTEDRMEQGKELQIEKVHLKEILTGIVSQLEGFATQKRVKLDLSGVDEDIEIDGDRILLQQAFYNLLHNAIKFSEMEEMVAVRSGVQDAMTVISIADKGPGIAAIDKPFIFEKYYHSKGSEEDSEKKGGMGLYITKFIIRSHQGEIEVESELGKGTTFIVKLPNENSIK